MYESYCKTQFFITILLLDINYEILIIRHGCRKYNLHAVFEPHRGISSQSKF
jgi:hypothetical protein